LAWLTEHYGLLVTTHLLCALTFGGAVIFEVLILESLHGVLGAETMMTLEAGIIRRARKFMPIVVGLLFASGLAMWHVHFPDPHLMTGSRFGTLLLVKMGLAGVVLVLFVTALSLFALGRMRPSIFKAIHLAVFTCVLGIVLLAKGMFYL